MLKKTLKNEKRETLRDAKELGYLDMFPDVISRINNATSENELVRILKTCRDNWYEPETGFTRCEAKNMYLATR